MSLSKDKVYSVLKELRENAYVPYSNFKVSCIIYLKNGNEIKDVNVENTTYNPTICAERSALTQIIAQGYNKNDVEITALIHWFKMIWFPMWNLSTNTFWITFGRSRNLIL